MISPRLPTQENHTILGVTPLANKPTINNAYETIIDEDLTDNLDDLDRRQKAAEAFEFLSMDSSQAKFDVRSPVALRTPVKSSGMNRGDDRDFTPVMVLAAIAFFFVFVTVMKWFIERLILFGLPFVIGRLIWAACCWLREDILGWKVKAEEDGRTVDVE